MSVLLDTNVVSELMRKSPDPAVEAWAAGHPLEALFFSAVGEAELRYCAAILPTGPASGNADLGYRDDAARCFPRAGCCRLTARRARAIR